MTAKTNHWCGYHEYRFVNLGVLDRAKQCVKPGKEVEEESAWEGEEVEETQLAKRALGT